MSRITKKFIRFDTSTNGTNGQVIPANYSPTYYTAVQASSEGSDKISAHLKGLDTATGALQAAFTAVHNPAGFETTSTTTISFNDATRVFTIAPVSGSFSFWEDGVKYTKNTSESVTISNVNGSHFVYYHNGVLTETTTFSSDIITKYAYVTNFYWDTTSKEAIIFGEERHGLMDPLVHSYLHTAFGTRYINGLALNSFSAAVTADTATGGLASDAQFGVDTGVIRDEDVDNSIVNTSFQTLTSPANIPIFYQTGSPVTWHRSGTGRTWQSSTAYTVNQYITASGKILKVKTAGTSGGSTPTWPATIGGTVTDGTVVWVFERQDNIPVLNFVDSGTTFRLAYNQNNAGTWQLTEVPSNNFVVIHYAATNDKNFPVIGILGQTFYTSVGNARTGITTELNDLITSGIPAQEFVFIASIIYHTNNTYTNIVKARIRPVTANTEIYIDWRTAKLNASQTASNHAQLSNLSFTTSGHSGFQKESYQASRDPGTTDDGANTGATGINFRSGDFWVNTTSKRTFVCCDSTTSAAVWRQLASRNSYDIDNTSFSLANNQSSAADVTGLSFSSSVNSFEALVNVKISATSSLYESFKLYGVNKGSSWEMAQTAVGNTSQVTFSITAAGQVQYTSGNYSGFSSGTIIFRALTV